MACELGGKQCLGGLVSLTARTPRLRDIAGVSMFRYCLLTPGHWISDLLKIGHLQPFSCSRQMDCLGTATPRCSP